MKIKEILGKKGSEVVTISPAEPVASAVRLLVNHGIGSVVVMDGDQAAGILTERDVLRMVDREPASLRETTVGDAMTRDLIVAVPTDDVSYVMEVMSRNRVRHLPIIDSGVVCGIISIGDVVNAMRREVESENRYLRDYVQGAFP